MSSCQTRCDMGVQAMRSHEYRNDRELQVFIMKALVISKMPMDDVEKSQSRHPPSRRTNKQYNNNTMAILSHARAEHAQTNRSFWLSSFEWVVFYPQRTSQRKGAANCMSGQMMLIIQLYFCLIAWEKYWWQLYECSLGTYECVLSIACLVFIDGRSLHWSLIGRKMLKKTQET